jgi:hypothetical protein
MRPELNRNYCSYRCASRQTTLGSCKATAAPQPQLENWAWEQVSKILRDPTVIASERQRRLEEGPDPKALAEREMAVNTLHKIERQQERLIRRFRESEDDSFPWDLVEKEISRAQAEKKQVEETIARIDRQLAETATAASEMTALEEYCRVVGQNLETFDFEDKRLALNALGIQVVAAGRDPLEWRIRGTIPLKMVDGVPDRTF